MGNVILHIGSPKTATTSFQSVLYKKCEQLTNFGFKVVKSDILGDVDVAQFPEISEYILREELDTHPRFFSPHFRLSSKKKEFLNSIRTAVQSPEETLIISCEDLFHVSNEDEIELLLSCLKPRKIIKVVCVLRERNAYLASLKKQLLQSGIPLSSNTQSVNFIHPKSWLVDYQRVTSLYGKCVGATNLIHLEYVKSPDFLPKLWVACDLPRELLNEGDVSWKNTTEGKSMVPQVRLVESDVRGFNILLVNYSFFCAKPKDKFHRSKTGPIVSTSLQEVKNIIERERKL